MSTLTVDTDKTNISNVFFSILFTEEVSMVSVLRDRIQRGDRKQEWVMELRDLDRT